MPYFAIPWRLLLGLVTIVVANMVMAYMVMAIYSYGLCSYGHAIIRDLIAPVSLTCEHSSGL